MKIKETIYPDVTGTYLALNSMSKKKLKIEAIKRGTTMTKLIEQLIEKL